MTIREQYLKNVETYLMKYMMKYRMECLMAGETASYETI